MKPEALSPSALSEAVNISQSYASMILAGERSLKLPLAIEIFRRTGHKLGPIATASDEEIDTLERFPVAVKLERQERDAA